MNSLRPGLPAASGGILPFFNFSRPPGLEPFHVQGSPYFWGWLFIKWEKGSKVPPKRNLSLNPPQARWWVSSHFSLGPNFHLRKTVTYPNFLPVSVLNSFPWASECEYIFCQFRLIALEGGFQSELPRAAAQVSSGYYLELWNLGLSYAKNKQVRRLIDFIRPTETVQALTLEGQSAAAG